MSAVFPHTFSIMSPCSSHPPMDHPMDRCRWHGQGVRLGFLQTLAAWIVVGFFAIGLLEAAPLAGMSSNHWAYQPVGNPVPPPRVASSHTEIDRFIVAALQSRGLSLSQPASRLDWIRRATFDLTGLPPSWEEVQGFMADASPDAREKVLDRLLNSPRYGERWGRHWLDLARYADTHGGSAIGFTRFPFSYTYRDYVIRSFNADVPYEQFVTEQIAADQLGLKDNDPALAG